jgi:hypothetical protein
MKTILAVILTMVAGSIAAAQSRPTEAPPQEGSRVAAPQGWCMGCTDAQKSQRISEENRGKDIADHNQWPAGPQVARSSRSQYWMFTTNFLVNNDSNKEIREVKWTATFINQETRETIQSFPLQTKKKIAPHRSKALKQKLFVPLKKLQGQVVSATQPPKDPKNVVVEEKYEIVEIVYKDKSVSRP